MKRKFDERYRTILQPAVSVALDRGDDEANLNRGFFSASRRFQGFDIALDKFNRSHVWGGRQAIVERGYEVLKYQRFLSGKLFLRILLPEYLANFNRGERPEKHSSERKEIHSF